jgi:hypothetical protein
LPNASRIQDWQVKIQTYSPVWQKIFPPLTDPYNISGQLFSDLASENTGLEKLIHTPEFLQAQIF